MGSKRRGIETLVGLFILAGMAALAVLAVQVSSVGAIGAGGTYTVTGSFQNVGSLKSQAPVNMAGVRIGRVTAIELDPETYQARVQLAIANEYDNLPADSSASVQTSGLLGEKFISMEPGGMPTPLTDGDELMLTQSALVLEDIIGQFLYDQAAGGSGQQSSDTE